MAIAVDWAIFWQMVMALRGPEVWPEDFSYQSSNTARKVLIAISGGAAGALWNDGQGQSAALIAAAILHLAIYVEWYRWRGSQGS
ncbi:hypothetical protein GCM10022281_07930 [Sphingomonas rosea]|uniref:Uncharacterized protein n=1 Tax=Sphingomonas rosea TaxID=335605 RepID=A0ABP7TT16_9SPHN